MKSSIKIIAAVALIYTAIVASASTSVARGDLPRKYNRFDLGLTMDDLSPDLVAFKCKDLSETATECVMYGYPGRDDLMILKFYRKKLVAIVHYTSGKSFDEARDKMLKKFGKPSTPEYKSATALTYTWKDAKTFITLTNLMATGYMVYEIRDVAEEPLFRKSRSN